MEPVAGKSGWDRELEETTNLKAMVGIELLYICTLLQTSREIRNDIIQSHVNCIILWLGTVRRHAVTRNFHESKCRKPSVEIGLLRQNSDVMQFDLRVPL